MPENLQPTAPRGGTLKDLAAVGALLLITLAVFADVLFTVSPPVLSSAGADLQTQYIHWRRFAVEQIRQGNFPLWNPHVFCGIPFFGGFQSAMLYPPNVLYLVLPLAAAIKRRTRSCLPTTSCARSRWRPANTG